MGRESTIETLHPQRRRGINISVTRYNEVAAFILQKLAAKENMTLAMLLKEGEDQFENQPDINSVIFYVKLDLEARRFIKMVTLPFDSVPQIKLTQSGKRNFKRLALK